MSSQSFIPSLAQAEVEADRLLDELFGELEATLKEREQSAAHPNPQSTDRARPPAPLMASMLWVTLGALGTVALAALALWWSFVHLPKQFTAQAPASPTTDSALDPGSTFEISDSALALAGSETEVPTQSPNLASLSSEEPVASEPAPASAPAASPVVAAPRAVAPPVAAAPPPAAAPSRPIFAAAPIDTAVPEFQLMGIIDGSNGQPAALLIVDNLLQTIEAGATIENGWRVASIRDRQVRVTNGRRTLTLQVGLQ